MTYISDEDSVEECAPKVVYFIFLVVCFRMLQVQKKEISSVPKVKLNLSILKGLEEAEVGILCKCMPCVMNVI